MKKIISDKEIIAIIDEMHSSFPGKKIKQADLVNELTKKGFPMNKSTICKNIAVKEHISKLNSETLSIKDIKTIVFNPINIHSLSNMNKKQIIDIITQREVYYSECAKKASEAKKMAEELQKQLNDVLNGINSPKDEEIGRLKKENQALKAVIYKHILSETANELIGAEMQNRKTYSINRTLSGDDIISDTVDLDTGEVLNEDKYENDVLNKLLGV